MASHAGLSRRAESESNHIITVIVPTIIGVVALLLLIVLVFIIQRRKRNTHQSLYEPPGPSMALHKSESDVSANSSLLRDASNDWSRSPPYRLSSHDRPAAITSTPSSILQEMGNRWYHPSPYPQLSHQRSASDANSKPSLQEMNSEWGSSNPYLSYMRFSSDSSSRPLLREMDNDRGYMERLEPKRRTISEEDILSNDPKGQYRIPVSRPLSRGSNHTPAAASFGFSGTDVTPYPYLTPGRSFPPLPPLTIPQKSTDYFISSQIPSTVTEESASSQLSANSASSPSSAYSQSTAHSPSHSTPLLGPQNEIASSRLEPQEMEVARKNTTLVGTLLKARAERNPGGLVRGASHISHIERIGSITSVIGSDKPYAQRYRAKKLDRTESMEALQGGLDRDSSQSSS